MLDMGFIDAVKSLIAKMPKVGAALFGLPVVQQRLQAGKCFSKISL